MCGITGTVFFDPNRQVSEATLRAMTSVLTHRGPDDEGILVEGNYGLGFRRLSIIDLSPLGNQPMCNEDGTVKVVCNGEIYNFRKLRKDLVDKGHVFRSECDTEVIVHAYEEYGADCLARLSGMFGLAILDTRNRKLILARDRLGIKPLYYRAGADGIHFGSELKAITQDPSVETEIDPFALNLYVVQDVIPAPYTIFKGIRKLHPGEVLVADLDKGAAGVQVSRYWHLTFEPDYGVSEREWQDRLHAKLLDVVQSHMMSDVPLGAFLSGGIDSSSVVSLMSALSDSPVESFTIRFAEKEEDEGPIAREVSDFCKTAHHELTVEVDSLRILDELVHHYDEPFGDSSAIPTYFVSKMAREHVTVILSGDGGDELFGGYFSRATAWKVANVHRIPRLLRSPLGLLQHLPPPLRQPAARRLTLPSWLMLVSLHDRIYDGARLDALQPEWRRSWDEILSFYDPLKEVTQHLPPLQMVLAADFELYLPNDILTKVDIASSAHSLETRVPLLDHSLVELAAHIPPELKFRGRNSKYIFRKTMEPDLPRSVFEHTKHGFSVPARAWSKTAWLDKINEIRSDSPAIAEIINFDGMSTWPPDLIWQMLFLSAFLARKLKY